MVKTKQLRLKKVCITIIVIILTFFVASFVATKIIYDSIFTRYDCGVSVASTLNETVSKRSEKSFMSGDNLLAGFLYDSTATDKKDALIILAPGHNACSDAYLWQIKELNELGWSVFAFDSTGCCRSQGKSSVGFPQELCDLKATINYVESNDRFGYNSLVLLGHSRGGYAACCALKEDFDIAAAISVSGINSSMEGVIGAAEKHVGPFAWGNYGFLWLYQASIFGADTVSVRADKVLNETSVPVLLIHGENDTTVPANKYSIVSYKDKISNDKVEILMRSSSGSDGHTNLLFDSDNTANDELIKKINDFLVKNI